jgi:uncharacterized membrane-anchored protein YhcB (DUF1043 family)
MMATTHAGLRPAGSRLACFAPIALVFLVGVIAGAVAMNLGAHKLLHPTQVPFWTQGGKQVSFQRWKKELNLTPEQSQQMTVILDDFGTYYVNVLSDAKARILRILNEDQQRKFNNLLAEQQR